MNESKNDGISMHDYFVEKTMQKLLENSGDQSPEDVIDLAYDIADAMLKAREANND